MLRVPIIFEDMINIDSCFKLLLSERVIHNIWKQCVHKQISLKSSIVSENSLSRGNKIRMRRHKRLQFMMGKRSEAFTGKSTPDHEQQGVNFGRRELWRGHVGVPIKCIRGKSVLVQEIILNISVRAWWQIPVLWGGKPALQKGIGWKRQEWEEVKLRPRVFWCLPALQPAVSSQPPRSGDRGEHMEFTSRWANAFPRLLSTRSKYSNSGAWRESWWAAGSAGSVLGALWNLR